MDGIDRAATYRVVRMALHQQSPSSFDQRTRVPYPRRRQMAGQRRSIGGWAGQRLGPGGERLRPTFEGSLDRMIALLDPDPAGQDGR
jgi:hypothetical protein